MCLVVVWHAGKIIAPRAVTRPVGARAGQHRAPTVAFPHSHDVSGMSGPAPVEGREAELSRRVRRCCRIAPGGLPAPDVRLVDDGARAFTDARDPDERERMGSVAVRGPHEADDAAGDPRGGDPRVQPDQPVGAAGARCGIGATGPGANVDVPRGDTSAAVRPLENPQLPETVVAAEVHRRARAATETQRAVARCRPPAVAERSA